MSKSKVSIDEMADEICKGLEDYSLLASDEMKSAVRKTAAEVKKEIKGNAPVLTGEYRNSWATKTTQQTSQTLEVTVYSKNRYRLTHLLENGHANRGGGRTKAYPHIAPAEENGKKMLTELIEKALKG